MLSFVEVFMDSKRNILLIPLWRENGGPGRSSNQFVKLEAGYSYDELGICINNMLSIRRENVPEDRNQKVHELATGIKSWSAFAKKHQLVSVVLNEKYRISKQLRKENNSFGLNKDEVEKYTIILPIDTPLSEIGKKVLEAFDLKSWLK